MSQDIKLNGKTYTNVPYTMLPKLSGGSAKFVDSSDATASAGSILNGYTAYVNGEKITGNASGTPTVLITKNIVENGIYDAEDDDADGYSSVTVNVQHTKYVSGTFTGEAADEGTAITVNVPYLGNGYPVSCIIRPTNGTYKASDPFYSLVKKSAIVLFAFSKCDSSSTPTYNDASLEANQADVISQYKNSDSDATAFGTSQSKNAAVFNQYSAAASNTACARFSDNKTLSVFIASSSYGFVSGVSYTYDIIYSE